MKVTQVVASAAGAVVAAVIASFFGVTGTIVGVAIGSMVATTATALVKSSLDRTTPALRQVVIDQNPLLRRVGGTATAGEVDRSTARTAPSEAAAAPPPPPAPPVAGTRGAQDRGAGGSRVGPAPVSGAHAARRGASTVVPPPGTRRPPRRRIRPRRWVLTAVTAAVIGLALVTVIEVAAGRPLAALVANSHAAGSTSLGDVVTGTPSTPSTSTTVPPTSTTTSAPGSSPASTSTTTTTVPTPSTSTTAPAATSTTVPRSATTTLPATPATGAAADRGPATAAP